MRLDGVREDRSFRLLDREEVFRGKVVGLTVDHIRLPGGHEARHEVLHLPDAVSIVPLLEEEGKRPRVVLVEQFRNSVAGFIHEVPAGIVEDGEDPAECAARELEEETGYHASRLSHLASLLPIPGTSAHRMHFFLAEGLVAGEQRLEAAECLSVKAIPLEDLIATALGARRGGVAIVDAKTQIGILHVAALRRRPDR